MYLENLLSDEETEALKIYSQDKQLEHSIKGKKSHCLFHKFLRRLVVQATVRQIFNYALFSTK